MYQEHVLEETLEAYAMGRLPEQELDRVDEHLLTCERCRTLLTETDERVRVMKIAAHRLRTEELSFRKREQPWWERVAGPVSKRPAWALGTIAVLGAILLLPGLRTQEEPALYRDVSLTAMRGGEAAVPAAGEVRLRLQLDLGGIAETGPFAVRVVAAAGEEAWRSEPIAVASADRSKLEVPLGRTLGAGQYWVRLYRAGTADGEILREYPLLVQ
jgi:anti-sigma factor RsiW